MRARRFYLASLASVVIAAAACSGIATSPSGTEGEVKASSTEVVETPSFGLLGGLNALLLQCTPLPASSRTVQIGSEGGYLQVGPHVLVVPPGALKTRTSIRGEVVPGSVNSVRFSPEGLKFKRDAYLTMSYSNCSGLGMLLPKKIVYTDEGLKLLEILLSLDFSQAKLVAAPIGHFSRYAIAY